MAARIHAQTIDKLTAADSVLSLLNGLRSERLPSAERMAIARAQIEAVEEWFAAFLDAASIGSARSAL